MLKGVNRVVIHVLTFPPLLNGMNRVVSVMIGLWLLPRAGGKRDLQRR